MLFQENVTCAKDVVLPKATNIPFPVAERIKGTYGRQGIKRISLFAQQKLEKKKLKHLESGLYMSAYVFHKK